MTREAADGTTRISALWAVWGESRNEDGRREALVVGTHQTHRVAGLLVEPGPAGVAGLRCTNLDHAALPAEDALARLAHKAAVALLSADR